MINQKLTKEQIQSIPELLKIKSVTEIAELFRVSKGTVNYWIHRLEDMGYKLPERRRGRRPMDISS